jgi:eukaryotic-like serine/threonine-protein kinase
VEALFFAALDKNTEAQRAAFLESACAGDAELRRHVEKLLDAHLRMGDFLKKPVLEQLIAVSEQSDDDEDGGFAFLEPATRPDSLGRLGHYEVLAVLGKGGFGIVFRAFDDVLQRVVAVKVLAPQLAATSPARKRFLREARASAQVRHDNVVQVHAVAEQPLPYLVMEFIPGETLQQRLDRTGPLELPEMLHIGRQIAEGLAAAHATNLIHRDIKPANILLEDSVERAKITDFGLARAADDAILTRSGVVSGTPLYMSPEQARGEAFDYRADLFSLGSVFYVMATGRPPFRASTTLAVLRRVVEDQPRPIRAVIPEVPEWLCAIVAKLQAKDPATRFQTAREVADLLADCEAKVKARQEVKILFPAPAIQPAAATAWKKRRGAGVVLLLALALAVIAGAGLTHWFRGQQPTPAPKPLLPAAKEEMPPLAITPFGAALARRHQEVWARHLGVPVVTTSKIGMALMLIPPVGPGMKSAYYLGKHEVTQGDWAQVMADHPSFFGPTNPRLAGLDTSKFPVEQVSWFDCVEFCNKLSERDGLRPFYQLSVTKRTGAAIAEAEVKLLDGGGYHIPTTREWEVACRAGTETKYHAGDQDEGLLEWAWFDNNSERRTHPVAEKKPNAFGLFDMHGNVWEWCAEEAPADSRDPTGALRKVFHGGSWDAWSGFCQSAYHYMRVPSDRVSNIGLRVARGP